MHYSNRYKNYINASTKHIYSILTLQEYGYDFSSALTTFQQQLLCFAHPHPQVPGGLAAANAANSCNTCPAHDPCNTCPAHDPCVFTSDTRGGDGTKDPTSQLKPEENETGQTTYSAGYDGKYSPPDSADVKGDRSARFAWILRYALATIGFKIGALYCNGGHKSLQLLRVLQKFNCLDDCESASEPKPHDLQLRTVYAKQLDRLFVTEQEYPFCGYDYDRRSVIKWLRIKVWVLCLAGLVTLVGSTALGGLFFEDVFSKRKLEQFWTWIIMCLVGIICGSYHAVVGYVTLDLSGKAPIKQGPPWKGAATEPDNSAQQYEQNRDQPEHDSRWVTHNSSGGQVPDQTSHDQG